MVVDENGIRTRIDIFLELVGKWNGHHKLWYWVQDCDVI